MIISILKYDLIADKKKSTSSNLNSTLKNISPILVSSKHPEHRYNYASHHRSQSPSNSARPIKCSSSTRPVRTPFDFLEQQQRDRFGVESISLPKSHLLGSQTSPSVKTQLWRVRRIVARTPTSIIMDVYVVDLCGRVSGRPFDDNAAQWYRPWAKNRRG